jgi:hypothetical protein
MRCAGAPASNAAQQHFVLVSLAIQLAGPWAQLRAVEPPRDQDVADHEYNRRLKHENDAEAIASHYEPGMSAEQVIAFKLHYAEYSRQLVETHWLTIDVIARELMKSREVSGQRVCEAVLGATGAASAVVAWETYLVIHPAPIAVPLPE